MIIKFWWLLFQQQTCTVKTSLDEHIHHIIPICYKTWPPKQFQHRIFPILFYQYQYQLRTLPLKDDAVNKFPGNLDQKWSSCKQLNEQHYCAKLKDLWKFDRIYGMQISIRLHLTRRKSTLYICFMHIFLWQNSASVSRQLVVAIVLCNIVIGV